MDFVLGLLWMSVAVGALGLAGMGAERLAAWGERHAQRHARAARWASVAGRTTVAIVVVLAFTAVAAVVFGDTLSALTGLSASSARFWSILVVFVVIAVGLPHVSDSLEKWSFENAHHPRAALAKSASRALSKGYVAVMILAVVCLYGVWAITTVR